MMKKIFTFLVTMDEGTKLEKILNTYRIGLNEWDKTKVFELQGNKLVNYTIVCTEEMFSDITMSMNGTRVY